MYEAEPELKVDELTMENTVKDINNLAMTIIQQIAASEKLHHSSHLPVNAFNILQFKYLNINLRFGDHY